MEFINTFITGGFDFKALGEFFAMTFDSIKNHGDLMWTWNTILEATSSFAFVFPIVFIAFGLIEILFGKKVLPVVRFLFCVVSGYVAGVLYIAPLVNNMVELPSYIAGTVIAIVAAVLCKFLYFLLLAVAAGYSVYIVSINGMIPVVADITKGNWLVGVIAVGVAVILAFVLRKFIEMAGTSVLGAFIISKTVIANYFDYRTLDFLGEFGWIAEIVIVSLLALIGFIIQVKTRKRY